MGRCPAAPARAPECAVLLVLGGVLAGLCGVGSLLATPPGAGSGGLAFTEVAGSSGLSFVHYLGSTGRFYFAEIAAAGCALLDFDNDGDLDVYLLQGTVLEPGKTFKDSIFPPVGPMPPRNRLFRNELIGRDGRTGRLRFTDVTEASGAGISGYGMGAATGDYDGDGDVDLYVTNFGPDVLLRNEGDGTFTDVTAQAGLGDPRWTTSASFFDYDLDGRLDLFVAAYADFTVSTNKACYDPGSGARDYCGPKAYPPIPARLYRNLGNGRFADVSAKAGVDTAYGHGLGVVAADFDGNGWPDVYVANDGDANQLWMNDRGRFVDMGLLNGAAYNEHGQAEAGMGIAVADYDDDQDLDLFVTNLIHETNTLYQNRGDGVFDDMTLPRGVGSPSLPFTGFGTGWFDLDHDADLDLFVANGDVRIMKEQAGEPYPYRQRNLLMINHGQGRYEDVSERAGAALSLAEVSRGAAFGDVDNDGDIDILVTNNNGPARLLRNDLAHRQTWILARVVDERLRRDAIGARVKVALSDGRILTRCVRTDGSYLSAGDPRVHVAWPDSLRMRSMSVEMPDGRVLDLEGLPLRRISTIAIGAGGARLLK